VTDTTVSPVGEGDRERAISTLVSAFIDDPVERWLFPEQEHYEPREHRPKVLPAIVRGISVASS
jgi:hypothetical protein